MKTTQILLLSLHNSNNKHAKDIKFFLFRFGCFFLKAEHKNESSVSFSNKNTKKAVRSFVTDKKYK